MAPFRLSVLLAALTGGTAVGLHAQSPAQLHGAWKLVEASLVGRDTTITTRAPQPGLVVFTRSHYSLMFVEGSSPRAAFADPARPTEAEKLAAFDSFAGHTGSYSVQDSVVRMNIMIAKIPSLMTGDMRTSFAQFIYRVASDTLWLTRRTPAGSFTMKLLRVE